MRPAGLKEKAVWTGQGFGRVLQPGRADGLRECRWCGTPTVGERHTIADRRAWLCVDCSGRVVPPARTGRKRAARTPAPAAGPESFESQLGARVAVLAAVYERVYRLGVQAAERQPVRSQCEESVYWLGARAAKRQGLPASVSDLPPFAFAEPGGGVVADNTGEDDSHDD